jgi:hypothetical protein
MAEIESGHALLCGALLGGGGHGGSLQRLRVRSYDAVLDI